LRPIASDFATGAQALRVDWMRLMPYSSTGTFLSRIIDGGATTDWGAVTWTADLPLGTTLVVSVRSGETAIPDATWSAFTIVGSPGAAAAVSGRYVQYRLELSTSSPGQTPLIRDVTLNGVNQ
jgi:hypothetical protein